MLVQKTLLIVMTCNMQRFELTDSNIFGALWCAQQLGALFGVIGTLWLCHVSCAG